MTEIVDISLLKYKVKYQNATLFAYAVDSDQDYAIDDEIYLQIPSNDFNKNPLIIGKVLKTPISATSVLSLEKRLIKYNYNLISNNDFVITPSSSRSITLNDDLLYFVPGEYNRFYLTGDITAQLQRAGDSFKILLDDTVLVSKQYAYGLSADKLNEVLQIDDLQLDTNVILTFEIESDSAAQQYTLSNLSLIPVKYIKTSDRRYC